MLYLHSSLVGLMTGVGFPWDLSCLTEVSFLPQCRVVPDFSSKAKGRVNQAQARLPVGCFD